MKELPIIKDEVGRTWKSELDAFNMPKTYKYFVETLLGKYISLALKHPHHTAEGWCCACEFDVAKLKEKEEGTGQAFLP